MKISIVIPTYNHCDDLLKPCIDSIIKYTDLSDIEVIISANGCKDNTKEYVESLGEPFKLVWNEEAIGYSRATNAGIEVSKGDYVLLLNNDIILLEQQKNTWIDMLLEPFKDSSVGLTGPLKLYSEPANHEFIVFFCCLIKIEVFDKIGLLDTAFGVGAGEDTDFCIKAENVGYKMIQVPVGEQSVLSGEFWISSYPLYHKGEGTVHDPNCVTGWSEIFEHNARILEGRYKNLGVNMVYSIVIPTYNHCDDLLKPCIESIIKYTDLTNVEVIISANGCKDNTKEYVESLGSSFKLVWNEEAIGYTRATNAGIEVATGEYIILLNNDIVLLHQEKNQWLDILKYPFDKQEKVGLTGPVKFNWDCGKNNYQALAFWLVMIKKEVFDNIGLLDEIYSPGMGEDGDFCIRAGLHGYKLISVPDDDVIDFSTQVKNLNFPIYHVGNGTFNDNVSYKNEIIERNNNILLEKYGNIITQNDIKVSVVIPTYNHCDDLLRPCIESIIKYTDLSKDIEIIISANGCTDNTNKYVESLGRPFKLVWNDNPMGYCGATNAGIEASVGGHIVLLNNDVILLEQQKNTWINMLLEPFKDSSVGITGPLKNYCHQVESPFIIFFCAMISRTLINKIGILDPIFGVGGGDDVDYCVRAIKNGFTIKQIPENEMLSVSMENTLMVGSYPIYHKGEGTMHDKNCVTDYKSVVESNNEILKQRYNKDIERKNKVIEYLKSVDTEKLFDEVILHNGYGLDESELRGKEVIDIGANIGMFTFLSLINGAKLVIAAEPVNSTFCKLATNVSHLGFSDKVILFKSAICNEFNTLRNIALFDASGHSSLYKESVLNEKVPTLTLNELLKHTSSNDIILKLDCEGAEFDIILDLTEEAASKISTIVCEIHPTMNPKYNSRDVIAEKLSKLGFVNAMYNQLMFYPADPTLATTTLPYSTEKWIKPKDVINDDPKYDKYRELKKINPSIKLNVGSGGIHVDGYISVDKNDTRAHILSDIFDLENIFPPDSVDEILGSHIFEHINPFQSMDILNIWKNILIPGGKLILELPNIEELCKNFSTANKGERYGLLTCIYGAVNTEEIGDKNHITSAHLFGWYPEILWDHMSNAGFSNIVFLPEQIPHPGYNFRVEAIKPL
jgi:FkbM family methyltransferase